MLFTTFQDVCCAWGKYRSVTHHAANPALIADRATGPVTAFVPVLFCGGVCLLSWIAVRSPLGLFVLITMYGFFGGVALLAIVAFVLVAFQQGGVKLW